MTASRPEWIIYKNDHRIGQAISWHKALDVLVKQERLGEYTVKHYANNYIVVTVRAIIETINYKIQNERR